MSDNNGHDRPLPCPGCQQPDYSCRCVKASSPAMNTASPTAPAVCEGCNGYGMVGNILDTDTCPFCGGSGEVTVLEGSGPDTYEMPVNCSPCDGTGAISQGSATSGEAVKTWRERLDRDGAYIRGSAGACLTAFAGVSAQMAARDAEIDDLRAALAASAEQTNSAGAARDEQAEDMAFLMTGHRDRSGDCFKVLGEILFDAGYHKGSPPVAERAAAPASVPEGYALTRAEIYTLRRLIECAEKLDARPRPMCRDCADEDGTCPNSGLECDMRKLFADAKSLHNKLAAPEVAQPAAQGEKFDELVRDLYNFQGGRHFAVRLEKLCANLTGSAKA